MLAQNETSFARIGVFALALAEWPWAHRLLVSGALARHSPAVWLVVLLYGSSFALSLTALAAPPPWLARAGRAMAAAFALVVVSAAYVHWVEKTQGPAPRTTDGHAYMDLAARLVLHGENPYRASLLEAYRIQQLPLSYATPLLDGDVSDRVAYPALSFLVLVPFLALGIPTYLVYGVAFLAAVGLVAHRAPPWARGLVLALFLHDVTLVSLGFDGVNDAVWVLFVAGAILAWEARPRAALALVGLACAHKQQAWFLVPFLALLVARERRVPLRAAAAIVLGVFAAFNLPFVVASPRAWLLGVTEPLVAPMITLSDGLSALTMTGVLVFPKPLLKGLFWLAYAAALFAYTRHPRALRHAMWILPAASLWFSNRALLSYWYFAALPAIASLVAMPEPEGEDRAAPAATARVLAITGASVVVLLALSALRSPPFALARSGPVEIFGRRIDRLHLRVTNTTKETLRPRFAVQGGGAQPLAWRILSGPNTLAPGASGDYAVSAERGRGTLDATLGGRVSVSADGDPSRAAFLDVPGDRPLAVADEIPNGRYALVDRAGVPAGWTWHPEGEGISLEVGPEPPLRVRFATVAAATPRRAELTTILALPEVPIDVEVDVPAGANVPPWSTLYGVRLSVYGFHALVLFGEAGEGTLPSGERYVSLPAARGGPATVRLDARALLTKLGAPLARTRAPYERAPELDAPSTPVALSLFAELPDGRAADVTFGAIHSWPRSDDALVRAGVADPAGLLAWHGMLDADMRNHGKAHERLAAAVAIEPTPERLFLLAEEERLLGRNDEALASYERALAAGWPRRSDALRGMARAAAQAGDCARAREKAELLRAESGEVLTLPCGR